MQRYLQTIPDRRAIIAGIATALAACPAGPRAEEQHSAPRRLGVLMLTPANDKQGQADAAALVDGLTALNWHDGGNIKIDWRWVGNDPTAIKHGARELTALDPEVIVVLATAGVKALRHEKTSVPIVFVNVTDPVGQGFVESQVRPGGNITGFSNYDAPMAGKWLQILTQVSPEVARVSVLFNPAAAPFTGLLMRTLEDAAPSLSVEVRAAPVKDMAEAETVMAEIGRDRGGMLTPAHVFALVHRDDIVALAARYRVPAVYPFRYFVAAGGLMSYGIEQTDPFRRAADYVDRILKGAKPSDLPVQAPTKFDLAINLKTAQALGLTVPQSLLLAADEVIE